jgi:nucleoside-diphosphate-sugar epimerase
MRIAITGGTGFLGGRLATYMAKEGHDIAVFSRTHDSSFDDTAIDQRFIDWESESSISNICTEADVVIHSAGLNFQDCEANPILAQDFNGGKTYQLASIASESKVKKFFYISTSHVYSNNLLGAFKEDSEPLNTTAYATSHLSGEKGVLKFHGTNEMQGIVIRASNIYGAPSNSNTSCLNLAVNQFYIQALQHNEIYIHSNPNTERNFLSATAFCSILNQLIEIDDFADMNILNVGASHSCTLLHMANLISSDVFMREKNNVRIRIASKSDSQDLGFDLSTERLDLLGIRIEDNFNKEIEELHKYLKNGLLRL